ncbi:MAG: methylenetetrahydrofolate reductase [Promethearchaeota archaeon]
MKNNHELPPSHFLSRMRAGEFLYGGEIEYSSILNLSVFEHQAAFLDKYVDVITLPDNPGGNIFPSNLTIAQQIRRVTTKDLILSVSCRDSNRLGLGSTLITAYALGFPNVLLVTGDHPSLGPIPGSKPVFDLDSTQLLQACQEFNQSQTLFGQKFEIPSSVADSGNNLSESFPHFITGSVFNVNSSHPDLELKKIKRKQKIGLDFIQTQIVFRVDGIISPLKSLQSMDLPTMVGITPMNNYSMARKVAEFLPGVTFPEVILKAYRHITMNEENYQARMDKFNAYNLEYYGPILQELKQKKLIQGIYFATIQYPEILPLMIKYLGYGTDGDFLKNLVHLKFE